MKEKPISKFQLICLEALAKVRVNCYHANARRIAHKIPKEIRGEKPNRYAIAVTSALGNLSSEWVIRCGPRDQWDSAHWILTEKAYLMIGYEFKFGEGWMPCRN